MEPARPARDPELTTRQREVLDLLARGMTNGQIAEALGISLDGAKWHVSEIIARLDLDTREEAAEYWRQRHGLRARLRLLTRTGSAPSLLRWLALGGGALAVVAVSVTAAIILLSGSDPEPASSDRTPTPAASASPVTATASPAVTSTAGNAPEGPLREIGGVAVRDLSIGDEVELPQGMLLYYNVSCYRCGGGLDPHRAYRRENGEVVTERIEHGLPLGPGGLLSLTLSEDATTMVAQFCNPGFCNGEFGFEPGTVVHTYTSTDGGISWSEWDPPLPFGSLVRGAVGDDWLVRTNTAGGFQREATRYWLYPSGRTLEPPSATAFPATTGRGELYWTSWADPQRPQQTDASGVPLPGAAVDADVIPYFATGQLHDRAIYTATARQDFSLIAGTGVYAVITDGNLATAALRWPQPGIGIADAASSGLVVGNALFPDGLPDSQVRDATGFDYRPVLIDTRTATVHSIAGLPRRFDSSGNTFAYPIEAVSGVSILRVATGGDCLNVRAEPAPDAEVLRCYVDGVLLFERDVDAPDGWVAVTTPDGREGWAATEFLER